MRYTCPACGNRDTKLMDDNGRFGNAVEFTLLCLAKVKATGTHQYGGHEIAADGTATCGEQWRPNELVDEQDWVDAQVCRVCTLRYDQHDGTEVHRFVGR